MFRIEPPGSTASAYGLGCARYVGRVGALAVALGVGFGLATGHGIGVARADSDSTDSASDAPSPNDDAADTTSAESAAPTPSEPSPDGETETSDASAADPAQPASSPAEMAVSSSGGANTSVNDLGQATDVSPPSQSTITDDPDATSETQPDAVEDLSEGVEALAEEGVPATSSPPTDPVAPPQSPAAVQETVDDAMAAEPPEEPSVETAAPHVSGLNDDVQPADAGDTPTSFESMELQGMAIASLNAPPPAFAPAPQPVHTFLAIPVAMVRVAATIVAAFLSPFLTPGPCAPAAPPLIWAVLAWIRREIHQTFFNRSPIVLPQNITLDADDVSEPVAFTVFDRDSHEMTYLVSERGQAGGPTHGAVEVDQASGTFTYTPDDGWSGTDQFTVKVSDAASGWHLHGLLGFLRPDWGHSDTATITVTVLPPGRPPQANDDVASTAEDSPISGGVLDNDTDPDGDSLTAMLVAGPSYGSVDFNADGTYTYTPEADYHGVDSFTYQADDGTSTSNIGTVEITVTAVNDGPVAVDDTVTTDEDTPAVIDVLANDRDPDGDPLDPTIVNGPAHGVLVRNPDGTFTYSPDAEYTGTDSFTYQLSDGTTTSAEATVSVLVTAVNDPPVAGDDTTVVNEEQSVTVDVLSNDADPVEGSTVSVIWATDGAHGSTVVNGDGTITYTPEANWSGTDTFTYTIGDGAGGTDTATVTVIVNPVNDAPIAGDDTAAVDEDASVTIDVLGNDSDPVEGNAVSVVSATDGAHGSTVVNGDGTITYTPEANWSGTDTFTYTITDGQTGDTATVTVVVAPVNDPPVAADDTATTDEDQAVTIDVLDNDTDPVEGSTVSVVSATNGAHGTTIVNGDGTITYTPSSNWSGTDTFTYTITDGDTQDTATVTVVVTPINDAPTAGNDTADTDEDQAVTIDVLDNDTDPVEGSTVSVVSATNGTHGTTIVNDDGTITYTPETNWVGTDTFTYTITDGTTGDTATVTVVVNPVNDLPVAGDDTATTDEDESVVIDVLANDSDPVENSAVSVVSAGNGAHGTTVVNPDGTITYTPETNWSGTDTFTYTITDGQSGGTATVTVLVNPVNDSPAATDDTATTDEDESVVIDVLANDSDPVEGSTVSVVSAGNGTHGTTVVNGDGTITYTPEANWFGTDTFSYTITDGQSGDTATVTVVVTPVNDAPTAVDDTAGTDEDQALTIDVLDNDSDLVEGSLVSVVSATNGTHGTTVVNGDGTITYTPEANWFGTDTFSYTITDGQTGDTATVTVVVTPVNDPPVAVDDTATTDEDQAVTIDVLGNDSDPVEGSTVSVVSATNGAHGSTVVNSDGTVTYTPAANWSGTDTFTYVAGDGAGGTDTATVTVVVAAVNDPPVAADDTATTDEDQAVTIDVLDNDTDPVEGSTVSVVSATNGAHGTTVVNGDGTITYTPNANWSGTETFTYTITDGDTQDTATVTVVVTPVNDPPVAVDDTAGTDEDQAVIVSVLANDSDPVENSPVSVVSATNGTHGSTVVNPNGTITYTPDANWSGTDTFTYTITDGQTGDTATVTVVVAAVNDPPVAGDDTATTDEDQAVIISVLSNDSDLVEGSPVSVMSATNGTHGTTVVNGDGTITYTPDTNWFGTDTFTYTITDGDTQDTATVTVMVTPVNDAPTAGDDTAGTDEDQAVTIDVLDNDSDPVEGSTVSVVSATNGTHGSTVVNGDGTITYTPEANWSGTDTFTYTITDGQTGDTATVTVVVTPVNDPPVAADDTADTDEDQAVTIDVLDNDADPVEGSTVSVVSAGNGAHGTTVVNGDGTITYTPEANWSGTDTFTYTITDGQTGDTATVTVVVNPLNDPPTAGDDAAATDEDQSVTINVLANDSDPVENSTVSVVSATDGTHGTTVVNPDGTITYTPEANWSGTDTFTYVVGDGAGGTNSATVTVVVTPVNDPPVAGDDTAGTDEDQAVTIDVLDNDTDPVEGSTVSVVSATNGTHGTTVVNGDGTITYTPETNWSGTDTFTYTITDGQTEDTATVTVVVNPVNDPPVAADDTAATDEDQSVTIDVLDNDTDPIENSTVSVVSATDGTHGTTVVNPDGTITYTPEANWSGTDTFTYTITDGQSGDTATVTVVVAPVNDPPVAGDDSAGTDEDQDVTIDVLDNDSDPVEESTVSVVSATNGAHGTTVVNPDGTITYTPSSNWSGTDTFTYVAGDGAGGTDTATVTVVVNPVNDAPVAGDDSAATDEDQVVTIDVLANDSDPVENSPVSVVSAGNGAHGTTVVNGDGTITYTPDTNWVGTDSFTYVVSDGAGGTDTGAVTVVVAPVNDAPTAGDDTAGTDEDQAVTIDVLDNDTDPGEGSTVSVVSATNGTHGSTVVNPDGTITYTPETNWSGTDTFTYTITDGQTGDTATVTVVVTPVNDAPIAGDDSAAVDEDQSVTIDVLANDTDPVEGSPVSATSATNGTHGTTVVNGDGTITYTPETNWVGTDTFTYTITDGQTGDTATVTVVVNPVNDPPVAADDSAGTDEDLAVTIDVLDNDSDPVEGSTVSVQSATNGTHGTTVVNPDGTITYTPDTNWSGTDTFTYVVSDGAGGTDTATVTVVVNPVNDPPVAGDDSAATDEDQAVTIDVLTNDSDPVEGSTVSVVSAGNGTHGTTVVNPDGTITYTPETNWSGTDTFTYTITDGQTEDTATVTVVVNPLNDPPTAGDDAAATDEDQSVTIDVLANDSDPVEGSTVSVVSAGNGTHGTTVVNGDGTITYTPETNWSGTDTFTYTITDGTTGDTATVTVVVNPLNDPPTAGDDAAATDEDQSVTIDVLDNDSDPVEGSAVSVVSATDGTHGTTVVNPNGTITYTPDTDWFGTDTFSYTITDGQSGDTATVTVVVAAVNDSPTAGDDSAGTDEDQSVTIDVLDNDTDPVEGSTVSVVSAGNGTHGTTVVNPDGTITYTPETNWSGTDTFTYTITDGQTEDTATVTVVVNPLNDPPTAGDDAAATDEDQSVTIDVLANDSDPVEGSAVSVVSATDGTHGTTVVNPDGTITYTPEANWFGTDTFTYVVSDGAGGTDTGAVTVVVAPVNDPPVAADDTAGTDEDQAVTIDVLANDSDPVEGSTVSVVSAGNGTHGTTVVNGDGTITYTPETNWSGTDTFTYTITDGTTGDTATVTVVVNPVNDPPTAGDDAAATDEDQSVTIDVLANDSDPVEGSAVSVVSATDGTHGTTVVNPDGTITYTPDTNWSGTDTFTYVVSDGAGGTDTATVTVVVTPVNDPPVAGDDAASTNEDQAVTIDVLDNDTDPVEGSPVSVVSATNGTHGATVVNPDGTITYTPEANWFGTDTFTYTITDGQNGDTATVTVVVNPVNDAPVAGDDTAGTDEDQAVVIDVLANDSDPVEGSTVSVVTATNGTHGTTAVNPDGTITYTPETNWFGTDTFTYTITDGDTQDTATVTVVVAAVNDAPVATDDTADTDEDQAVTIDVLDNDTDPVEGSTVSVVSATNGTHGTTVVNGDGTITYTPDANWSGTDSFTYVVGDGAGGTNSATVTVVVRPINDAPIAGNDTAGTDEDQAVTIDVLDNDTDPVEGSTVSVVSATNGTHGNTVVNPDGTITYTPSSNWSGTDTFTYTITDGDTQDTATVTVLVTPINDAPTAGNDTADTDEDQAVTIDVLDNDTDPIEGSTVSVITATNGTHGTTVINPDGTITYTPETNWSGTDTFTYTITDGTTGDTATVTVVVNPVNDPPVAGDDTAGTDEDQAVVIDVLANDSDPVEGSTVSVVSASNGTHGTTVVNGDGTITYTPEANWSGTDTFTYTITDGTTGNTATVTVVVTPVNDPPVAGDDTTGTDEDQAVTIDVLDNDSDPVEGSPVSVVSATNGTHGTTVVNGDGTITYTPETNWSGTDTFSYTITDGQTGDTATVTVMVTPVNDAPTAVDDSAGTDEDQSVTIDVLDNDTDPVERSTVSVVSATNGTHGTTVVNGDGTITYTPEANWFGTDTFSYTITDGQSGDTATVTVVVAPVNDAPTAADDTAGTDEDQAVTIDVLDNDTDPVEGSTVSVVSATDGTHGSTVVNPDGTITYTPDADWFGTDTFTYTITDGQSGDTATVTVVVAPVNDPPVAGDDSAGTDEDHAVTIDVLANDSDPVENSTVSVVSAGNGTHGATVVNGDGTITYTPDANWFGTDTFTYTITDGQTGDTATVTVVVAPVNDPPVAADDTAGTDEDQDVTIDVLDNDTDPVEGSPVSVVSAGNGTHGATVVNGDGTITYTPDANWFGTDTFTYVVGDGGGGTDTATVTVVVAAVNDAPTAGDDSAGTDEDQSVTIDVLDNDTDPVEGSAVSVVSAGNGTHGTTVVNGDGTITYTPESNWFGTDTFTYVVGDGAGGTDTATVTVVVTPVNDAPTAGDDTAGTDEDQAVTIDVLTNDTDPVEGSTVSVVSATDGTHGTTVVNGDGTITYTPETNWSGTDTFTYTITDGNTGDTATVTVVVDPVNDAPTAGDDTAGTDEDQAVVIDVLDNDTDPVEGSTVSVVSATNGTHGTTVVNGDGTITYTPEANWSGTDTFTYVVGDGSGGTDTAMVTVVVAAVNDPPVAGDDTAGTDEDQAVTISVLANDSDPVEGSTISVVSATNGTHGTTAVNPDGTITYTPSSNWSGTDTFTYTITDGQTGDTATVTVVVNPVNDPPIAADDTAATDEDQSVTIDVLDNDTDPIENSTVSVVSAGNGTHGSTVVNPDGTITYTPEANWSGTDTFTYVVNDGAGGTDSATVTVVVAPINDPPVAADDTAGTDEDQDVTIDVLDNDSDPVEGSTVSVQSATNGTHGTTVVNGDGTITYTPESNWFGTDTFTYVVSDGAGGTDTGAVTVVVAPINDPPVAADDTAGTDEDQAVTIDVLDNDTDPVEGSTVSVVSAGNGTHGTTVVNGDGTVTYTPETNWSGTDTFTYTITDGQTEDTATVTVVVNPLNDPPTAGDDAAATDEDQSVTIDVLANDSDPVEGSAVSVVSAIDGTHGTTVVNPDGTITYTPEANWFGTDTFSYVVRDGAGGTDTGAVTVVVAPINDAPTAGDDSTATNEDQAVTIDVLDNDTDPVEGSPVSVVSATDGTHGTTLVNGDGTITYTPDAHWFGTDTFTYVVGDGAGGTDTATVTVVVNPVNDAPVAGDDSAATDEDQAVTISVLANDTDPVENSAVSVVSATNGTHGTTVVNGDGTITYTPETNWSGTDTFTYTITDGDTQDTATVTVVVTPVNDAPVAVDDGAGTDEDQAVIISVLDNDADPVEGSTVSVVSATNGTHGSTVVNPDGTITYTPDANWFGTDTFTYTITDGQSGDIATVTVVVAAVNDAPTAGDDSAGTDEDQAVVIDVLANDSDPVENSPVSVVSAGDGTHGTTVVNPDGTITYTPEANWFGTDTFSYTITDGQSGDIATVTVVVAAVNDAPTAGDDSAGTDEDQAVIISVLDNDADPVEGSPVSVVSATDGTHGSTVVNPDGTITYTPEANWFGTDTFTYTITDGQSGDTATVTVVVAAVNDAPTAGDDSAGTDEDQDVTIDVLANDTDPVEGSTVTVVSAGDGTHGTTVVNPDGTITYTPEANWFGTDTFSYTITDGQSGDTATVTVVVAAVNDAPTAGDDSAGTDEDQDVTIDVLDNDTDPVENSPVSVVSATDGTHGTTVVNPDGTITYTPEANWSGTDTFTYTITDGQTGDTATVTVVVNPVNDPPVAADDTATTNEDQAVVITVLTNDADVETANSMLSVVVSTDPSHGSVVINPDGTVTYTPEADYHGADSFVYRISDGSATSNLATVTLTITAVNDAPIATNDAATTNEDTAVSGNVRTNDTDIDNGTLTVTLVNGPTNGTLTLNANGSFTYTPNADFNGTDTFTYQASDGQASSNVATVTLTITAVNDAPIAANDTATTNQNTAVSGNVLANDTDIDSGTLTATLVAGPTNGTLTLNANGSYTYTPTTGYNGPDSFTYRAFDGTTTSGIATVSITVVDNVAPTAVDVQMTNTSGGTVGRAEQGDTITFTFSEPISPTTILPGWDGTSTNVVVRMYDNGILGLLGGNDTLQIYNAANTAALPLGTVDLGRQDYVSGLLGGQIRFGADGTPSTMTMSGNTITVVLGSYSVGGILVGRSTAGGAGTSVWTPSTTPTDFASLPLSSNPATETGTTADREF